MPADINDAPISHRIVENKVTEEKPNGVMVNRAFMAGEP
jgi:hypothetical protein